jgi:hypothetical protein
VLSCSVIVKRGDEERANATISSAKFYPRLPVHPYTPHARSNDRGRRRALADLRGAGRRDRSGTYSYPRVHPAADAKMSVTPRARDAIRGMAADEPARRVGRQGPHPSRTMRRAQAAPLPVLKPSDRDAARQKCACTSSSPRSYGERSRRAHAAIVSWRAQVKFGRPCAVRSIPAKSSPRSGRCSGERANELSRDRAGP